MTSLLSTARNADSAEKTVDQIVADIKKGTVDQSIVQAALTKGLIVKVAGHKRSAEAAGGKAAAGGHAAAAGGQQPAGGHPSHISGPKGEPHAADNIAQHILTDGYIPPKIQAALIASKHYLAPGQHPSNPTGAPKGTAAAGGRSQAGTGAAATKQHVAMGGKSPRDLVEDSLYARDIIPSSSFSLYAREAEAEAEAYAYAAAEAKFSMDDMRNLVHATETNPIAEKAVYNALTMDPNVERVSEGLVRDWVNGNGNNGGDSEKRDVYDEYYY